MALGAAREVVTQALLRHGGTERHLLQQDVAGEPFAVIGEARGCLE